MSILMKKPRIEEIADALGDAKKTLLSVLDGPGEYARFDLEKGPLPVGGAPLVRRSILSYKGREYPGVYLRTTLGSHFIEVSGKEECATYEVDEANRRLRKVDEPLSAEELRRVLGGGSGGGSGLPDDYAQQLQSMIQFAGTKTEVGGDLGVDGKAYFCGKNALIYHGTVSTTAEGAAVQSTVTALMMKGPVITIQGEPEDYSGAGMVVLASQGNDFMVFLGTPLKDNGNGTTSPATLEDVYNDNWDPYTSIASCKLPLMIGDDNAVTIGTIYAGSIMPGGGGIPSIGGNFIIDGTGSTLANVEAKATGASQAKYQHTVTISGEGFEFCFTAPSSKNIVVNSYQDLGIVFGGERIGLTGYSHALSAKPVLIDLHGGSESNDFIRVFEENGNTFANHTLSSLGAITFSDDVCPN